MKPRLLIVEDDPNLGEILSEYLGLKGYETTLSRDGEEGEEAYKNGTFDLCILDLMMPKKDGFALAKEIRSMDEEIPIIFLTAKSMKQDIIKG
ncbi:MAG: response regulator, partial [Bacteroidota bacterium]